MKSPVSLTGCQLLALANTDLWLCAQRAFRNGADGRTLRSAARLIILVAGTADSPTWLACRPGELDNGRE